MKEKRELNKHAIFAQILKEYLKQQRIAAIKPNYSSLYTKIKGYNDNLLKE